MFLQHSESGIKKNHRERKEQSSLYKRVRKSRLLQTFLKLRPAPAANDSFQGVNIVVDYKTNFYV